MQDRNIGSFLTRNPKVSALIHCVILVSAIALAVWITIEIERDNADQRARDHLAARDQAVYQYNREIDDWLFAQVRTNKGVLVTGDYVLETRFSGMSPAYDFVHLEFDEGNFKEGTGPFNMANSSDLHPKGNSVSWGFYSSDDGWPPVRYVGVIDGRIAWGKVYSDPGDGWSEGRPAAYGRWILRLRKDGEKSKSDKGNIIDVITKEYAGSRL